MEILGIAWENILIGLISGGLIGAAALLKNWFLNFRIEKKFPIAGRYITKFEDELDGEHFTTSAPALLRQKGNKIIGETSLPGDNRKWILDGEVSSGGHIHGVYYAEDPHDKGIGNFFLYINHRRHMEGLWSGFDSINQKITSGRYSFEPCIENIKFRDAKSKDLPKILEISDAELGKDYLDETIKDKIVSKTTIFRVAESSSEGLVGFCYSYLSNAKDIITELGIKKLPKALTISSKIVVLKTIAVSTFIKGRGVGSSLIKDSLEIYNKQEVESIYCLAWRSKKGTNIHGLLNIHNFSIYEEIPNFWTKDSQEKGYLCPECGNPCKCVAVIYTKAL